MRKLGLVSIFCMCNFNQRLNERISVLKIKNFESGMSAWIRIQICERKKSCFRIIFFIHFFVDHSFDYVAHFVFWRDVWIRTKWAAVASRRATSLATSHPHLATHLPTVYKLRDIVVATQMVVKIFLISKSVRTQQLSYACFFHYSLRTSRESQL